MSETARDPALVIDHEGCIQRVSADAEYIFGYPAAELLGRNLSSLMPCRDGERLESTIARYLAPDEFRDIGEVRIVIGNRKDGGTFPMQLTFQEVRRRGQRLFDCFIRDLTVSVDRERSQQELRTALLHVAQAGELDHLTSTLSQEVTAPLTEIRHNITASEDLSPNADQFGAHLAMASMVEVADRLSDIVQRTRGLLRRPPVTKRAENLQDIIEVASGMALANVHRALTLTVRIAGDAMDAVVDRNEIQFVLSNLIRNAVQAMVCSERPEITIATARTGDMVEISISDTGPGIAAEIRPRLFQAFVTTRPGGIGVGLSSCRAIVAAHGGTIHAEDGEGVGAVFRFTLPAVAEGSADANHRPPL